MFENPWVCEPNFSTENYMKSRFRSSVLSENVVHKKRYAVSFFKKSFQRLNTEKRM